MISLVNLESTYTIICDVPRINVNSWDRWALYRYGCKITVIIKRGRKICLRHSVVRNVTRQTFCCCSGRSTNCVHMVVVWICLSVGRIKDHICAHVPMVDILDYKFAAGQCRFTTVNSGHKC